MTIRMISTMAASAVLLAAAACGADEATTPATQTPATQTPVTETQAETTPAADAGMATTETDTGAAAEADVSAPGTIAQVAMDDARLTTLVAAIQAAGLGETLSGEGPFTVFAPTNEAFAALPAGTVEALLLPENLSQLQGVLTFHVVPGRVMSADLAGQSLEADTANGAKLAIDATGSSVMVGGATVVQADIEASNGVIHIVDAVLLPSAE